MLPLSWKNGTDPKSKPSAQTNEYQNFVPQKMYFAYTPKYNMYASLKRSRAKAIAPPGLFGPLFWLKKVIKKHRKKVIKKT